MKKNNRINTIKIQLNDAHYARIKAAAEAVIGESSTQLFVLRAIEAAAESALTDNGFSGKWERSYRTI